MQAKEELMSNSGRPASGVTTRSADEVVVVAATEVVVAETEVVVATASVVLTLAEVVVEPVAASGTVAPGSSGSAGVSEAGEPVATAVVVTDSTRAVRGVSEVEPPHADTRPSTSTIPGNNRTGRSLPTVRDLSKVDPLDRSPA
jgi:hypothetical protein